MFMFSYCPVSLLFAHCLLWYCSRVTLGPEIEIRDGDERQGRKKLVETVT
jgi:hypothetical protein